MEAHLPNTDPNPYQEKIKNVGPKILHSQLRAAVWLILCQTLHFDKIISQSHFIIMSLGLRSFGNISSAFLSGYVHSLATNFEIVLV